MKIIEGKMDKKKLYAMEFALVKISSRFNSPARKVDTSQMGILEKPGSEWVFIHSRITMYSD